MYTTFQTGHVFKRGKKRREVWVGCYRESVLDGGQLKRVQRRRVLGLCAEMEKWQAMEALSKILRPANRGEHGLDLSLTFEQFATQWKAQILPNYRHSTGAFYQRTLDHMILPNLKAMKLAEIGTREVQAFLNLFSGYSISVIRHIRATLSVLMSTAMDWEYITRNPVEGVKMPRGKPVKRAPVLMPEQSAQVIGGLSEPYRTMVVIASATAMRESEVLALKWEDFDTVAQTVKVQRGLYKGTLDIPKTEKSVREIPYGDAVKEALEKLAASGRPRGEFLFLTKYGNLFSAHTITKKIFRPLSGTLGIPPFTWRSFRRSAETTMHLQGVPLKVQSQIMGHSSPSMTMLYADPNLAEKRKAVEHLEGNLVAKCCQISNLGASQLPN